LLLPAVSANGAGFTRVSRDGIPRAILARKGAPPACEPIGAEGENWACITPPTRVTMPPGQLSMESIAIPVKSSNQPNNVHRDENHAKQTDLDAHRQCRGTAVGSRKSTSLGARGAGADRHRQLRSRRKYGRCRRHGGTAT